MLRADEILKESLLLDVAEGDLLLAGWAERIAPFDVSLIPTGAQAVLPDFGDPRLDEVEFSPIQRPLSTAWIPLPPRQPPAGAEAPPCVNGVRDLMLPEAVASLERWLEAMRADLININASLARGVPPDQVERDRPPPLAIGQAELKPWARGRVWDCTRRESMCCVGSDFRRIPQSHLRLDWLRSRLASYPDQGLVSHLLEGVRLEADVELHSVLVPHLVSLPLGFASVDRELRRMQAMGWYSFFQDVPFWPIYLNGQGATARKLETTRFRRTLEGGGPRQPVFDSSGLRAIPLNEASRVYHMPAHFVVDQRPQFKEWLTQRGLPAPSREPTAASGSASSYKFSKWPKERKPQLGAIMRDVAVLKRAAEVMREPVYSFGDDAKDYFNQLTVACSEYHKLGITFLAKGGEAPGVQADQLYFISELRLPFGLHCASNVAQRFSDAILDLFREEMDSAEWKLNRRASGHKLEWLRSRLRLQRRTGEPCVRISRFTMPGNESSGSIPAPLEPSDIPCGYVCPQLRLYTAYMFTDDPQFVVVSPELAKVALRAEQQLVRDIGLSMAIPEKRSLGSWSKWIGVLLVVALGLVVVPKEKILRAEVAISAVMGGKADFSLYRSLCGLLEHLRAINLQPRNIMYGLYRPHRPDGESRFGPAGRIVCDPLMRKQLERWRSLLAGSCCVSVKRALMRTELEKTPDLRLDIYSDACHADVETSGIGGYCHGLYWFVPVEPQDRPYVHIPVLELLGAVMNVVVLHPHLQGLVNTGNGRVRLVLRTDALTTASGLPSSSLNSDPMVAVHLAVLSSAEWQALAPYLEVEHIFGDANPLADAVSRQEWDRFHRLCAHLGVKPHRLPVPEKALRLLRMAVDACKHGLGSTVGGPAPSSIPIEESAACFGGCSGAASPCIWPREQKVEGRGTSGVSPPAGRLPPFPRVLSAIREPPLSPSSPLVLQQPRPGARPAASASMQASNQQPPSACGNDSTSRMASLWTARLPELGGIVTEPALSQARRQQAVTQSVEATADNSAMGFRMSSEKAVQLFDAVATVSAMGGSAATRLKEGTAWRLWEVVCAEHGTAAVRTAEDVRLHPQRTAHLLACLLLHAFAVCAPKSKNNLFIKPESALAYPLAIIRCYAGWGIALPGAKMLKQHVACLKRVYVQRHGSTSLAPRRAEPMRFSMVARMQAIKPGSKVGRYDWLDSVRVVFVFKRLSCFLIHTAFRLGEIVAHVSGEVRYLTFSSVVWRIDHVVYLIPPQEKLLAMVPGRDIVFVTPCVSKPDQTGEVFCPFPVSLTFDSSDINPVAALRDLELDLGCRLTASERASTALFCDERRQPFTYATLTPVLKAALTHCYGEAAASLYTFHSYRSGLATALHAAGVEDAIIQLVCRWMCPASLQIYRRIGTREHENLVRRAAMADVDTMQSKNVPRVAEDLGYATIVDEALARPHAPNVIPSAARAATPAPARQPCAGPLRQQTRKRARPRPNPPSRRERQRISPDCAASLARQFPNTLNGYATFFERPSARRAPTARFRQGGTRSPE